MLNRKNRLFKNYKKHRFKVQDKVRLDAFGIEYQQAVESAKLSYLKKLGNEVNNPQKSYWKIFKRVPNKCRAPKIPPLTDKRIGHIFILSDELISLIRNLNVNKSTC